MPPNPETAQPAVERDSGLSSADGQTSKEFALRVATDVWGLGGELHRLPGYVDENFRVECDGRRYVLKLAHADADEEYVSFQLAILEHLASKRASGADLPLLPRLVWTPGGKSLVPVEDAQGRRHVARMVEYIEGATFASAKPQSRELLASLGSTLARVDTALQDFAHPGALRYEPWDIAHAPDSVADIDAIEDGETRRIVAARLETFGRWYGEVGGALPTSVIHNDANDHNVVISAATSSPRLVVGLIDFGDAVRTATIFEVAIACTYAMLGKNDPLGAARHVVAGYASVRSLTEAELHILLPAIRARLSRSLVKAAKARRDHPDNVYLQVSDQAARALLTGLEAVDEAWAEIRFREACGLEPCSRNAVVSAAIRSVRNPRSVLAGIAADSVHVYDLSVGGSDAAFDERGVSTDPDTTATGWEGLPTPRTARGHAVGIGRYAEYRLAYSAERYLLPSDNGPRRRTLHLGVDVFDKEGALVYAPIEGVVVSAVDNRAELDYGPTLIIRHAVGDVEFFALYGHLSRASLANIKPGDAVEAGAVVGTLGDESENGGWPPHLHFQLMTRLLGTDGDFPGVAPADEAECWLSVCPNPAHLLGLPDELVRAATPTTETVHEQRDLFVGKALSLSYNSPLHIVRGQGTYLYSVDGGAWLDCVNNVCHVGHCNPRVAAAAARQMSTLNTNTRYLHDALVEYAALLTATLPDPLTVCFFVNSGSEANDLAIRLARVHGGSTGVGVLDHAYHGNLSSLIDISPYKFNGPGGSGKPDHVAVLPIPDLYRGVYRDDAPRYLDEAEAQLTLLAGSPYGVSAFFAESMAGCAGQVVYPPGYLRAVYDLARNAGAVCVADEVQVGFGRVGSHFWGFETQGVVPDIVTMGKPMGNGHPIGAVVTTRAIADSFANGMEYFNSYGGNPVSCVAGAEVLRVIRDEHLQEKAHETGEYLLAGLRELQGRYPLVGDVRGRGLFIGVELVDDEKNRTPAARQASVVVNRMKEKGVLLSTDGPDHNVIKIKPPLTFGRSDADLLLSRLTDVLQEDATQPAPTA